MAMPLPFLLNGGSFEIVCDNAKCHEEPKPQTPPPPPSNTRWESVHCSPRLQQRGRKTNQCRWESQRGRSMSLPKYPCTEGRKTTDTRFGRSATDSLPSLPPRASSGSQKKRISARSVVDQALQALGDDTMME